MSEFHTRSTSRTTAQASDVVLRLSTSVRLIFRPTLLDNHKNKKASVKGVFLYQKKSRNGEWVDFETIPLNSVKQGEGFKLELKSEELLNLVEELQPLYQIGESQGVPRGEQTFVKATPQVTQLQALDEPSTLIDKLLELDPSLMAKLDATLSVHRLRTALGSWEENHDNGNEAYWQQSLAENSFVLEQVFSWPTSVIAGKAYVRGKEVFNQSGNMVDFLFRNGITHSAALIEIRTPTTRLLGTKYRQTYNVSSELSGAIMQTLNYKRSLQENYQSLNRGHGNQFDSFNPKCVVVVGHTRQLEDHDQSKAFELYRHQFPGLAVIPFDELFDRTRKLISLLENDSDIEDGSYDDNIPF